MHKALLGLVATALLLSACGDDETPDAATGATSSSTVATTAMPGDTTTTTSAETRRCESVGFTPNSEDAASDILATGLDCDTAREFVRAAGRRTSSGGPDQLEVGNYRCVRTRTEQEPLPRSFYECTSDEKKVSFVRS